MPVAKSQWMTPSVYVPKDQFGHDAVKTRFSLTARLNDGLIVWRGWFEDRDDLDQFLWAIAKNTLRRQRALWDLPVPNWSPDIGERLTYEFVTVTTLTSPTGSNQTYTRPADWNNASNTIDAIGGGGGGAGGAGSGGFGGAGAGGGAFSRSTNISLGATANLPDWCCWIGWCRKWLWQRWWKYLV